MRPKLLTILTVRSNSERLPNKILGEISSKSEGKRKQTQPLIIWLLRRLAQINNSVVVVATTTDASDNELVAICEKEGVPVLRGSTDDVIGRMQMAVDDPRFMGAKFIFRALGDCPFIDTNLVSYATRRMEETGKEAFVYAVDSEVWPVYGAREFPFSRDGWERINARSPYREHPDQWFHLNRDKFNILYHLPPENVYFRQSYRLEIDYPEDLELVKVIAAEVGMLADLKDVIKFLDVNPAIARLNANCIEKTGPLNLNTYDNAHRRKWLLTLSGKPIMTWQGELLTAPDPRATPVFCRCGALLGHGWLTRMYTAYKPGVPSIMLEHGYVKCAECGSVREWRNGYNRPSETGRL